MLSDLISVVVPIYNVEDYLDDCIISIVNQTYNNIEILLIDDGSTDSSSYICEKYVKKDERIRYYLKKNGGLSDARNFGIKKAIGKYITFIDSDDMILSDYIETLYCSIISSNTNISICKLRAFQDGEKIKHSIIKKRNTIIINKVDAFKEMLLERKFGVSACGKLFLLEYFNDVEFPYGRLYEDLATTFKLIEKSNKIAFVDEELYQYRKRYNSITTSNFDLKRLEIFDSLKDFSDFIFINYPNLAKYCVYRKCDCAVGMLESMGNGSEFKIIKKSMKRIVVRNLVKVVLNKDVTVKKKIKIILSLININLLRKLTKK